MTGHSVEHEQSNESGRFDYKKNDLAHVIRNYMFIGSNASFSQVYCSTPCFGWPNN